MVAAHPRNTLVSETRVFRVWAATYSEGFTSTVLYVRESNRVHSSTHVKLGRARCARRPEVDSNTGPRTILAFQLAGGGCLGEEISLG